MARYYTTDPYGVTLIEPDIQQMRTVISSLEDAEDEPHPDATLSHESGWVIGYSGKGVATLEYTGNGDGEASVLFMREVTPRRALEIWSHLAAGRIETVRSLNWVRE